MPARKATKTPIASKYEFTCKALIPSFSGVACIWVLLSPTAMICTVDRPLKLRIALPPQAVAGITTASTRSAVIDNWLFSWAFWTVNCGALLRPASTQDRKV